MNYRLYRVFQFILLAGLGIFIFYKYISGQLIWYINQRFLPLSWLAILGFLGMAAAVIFSTNRSAHHHDHDDDDHHEHHDEEHDGKNEPFIPVWGIFFIFIPLLLGLTIPAKPLSASAIDNRGISSNAPLTAGGGSQTANINKPSEQRTVLDWVKLFNYQSDLSPFLGQKADVLGFVYHDPRLPAGHFMVSRFAITCCVADAFAIGMIVETKDADSLKDNTWVTVKGPVQTIHFNNHQMPLILADMIQDATQPQQPYLFP
jgi:putative membrane protein